MCWPASRGSIRVSERGVHRMVIWGRTVEERMKATSESFHEAFK